MDTLNNKHIDLSVLATFLLSILITTVCIIMLSFSCEHKIIVLSILGLSNIILYIKIYRTLIRYKIEFIVTIKEMNHRIKNNINILTNIIDLKKYVYTDDSTKRLLCDLKDKTVLISNIHEKIYKSDDREKILLNDYIRDVIDKTNSFYDSEVTIAYMMEDDFYVQSKYAVNMVLILQEMFTNSIKYAYDGIDDKKFSICIRENANYYEIYIADNGCGIDETKLNNIDSLGLDMVKTIVKQYKGKIHFNGQEWMSIDITLQKI